MFHTKPSSADAVAPARAPVTTLAESASTSSSVKRNPKIVDSNRRARPNALRSRQHSEPREELLVEKILQSFNTWSFKREQPDNLVSLRQSIGHAVHQKEAVPFVLYWGKGPRRHAGAPEAACFSYLNSFADRIRGVYDKGAAIRLICTDTHANLNGHLPEAINEYFGAIRAEAKTRGFTDCLLTELVSAAQDAGVKASDEPDPDPQTLQKLHDCAAKWYRGEGSASKGAIDYYHLNMIEKRAVEFAFPYAVFITFNGSEFRCLFPDRMPVFYMYSLKRGVAVKPWFLPDEAR